MKIHYPAGYPTAAKKTAFLYRCQEILRLQHNIMGDRTHKEFVVYLEKVFNPISEAITQDILKQRQILKQDTSHNINLEDVIK